MGRTLNGIAVGVVAFGLACAGLAPSRLRAADTPAATQPASAPAALNGTWLLSDAPIQPERVMASSLRVADGHFVLHGFWGLKADWTGSFSVASDGNPQFIDVRSDGISFQERGLSAEYPACRLRGLFKREGDRLTVALAKSEADPRPADFAGGEHVYLMSFVHMPDGWAGFPKTVKITVLGPDGRPDPRAALFGYMARMQPLKPQQDGRVYVDTTQPARLTLDSGGGDRDALAPDGTLVLSYDRFVDQTHPCGARDADRGWMGLTPVWPAILKDGALTIRMQAERVLRGTIGLAGERPPGEAPPWRAAYLTAFGDRFAFCAAPDGAVEFRVPPGTYAFYTYGNDLQSRTQQIVVPPGHDAMTLPPVKLRPSALLSLIGKPAPALAGVTGWKNGPVSLADLKGRVVLLDFWGYWCGNCVVDMPKVFRLYDKYKEKGLAIVSIHVDDEGDVSTAAELDARTKLYRANDWNGRDLPFPVALCPASHHQPGSTPALYGVSNYPTVLFLDRAGNVLGQPGSQLDFTLDDDREADAGVEKLLAAPVPAAAGPATSPDR